MYSADPGKRVNGIYEDFNKMAAEIAGIGRYRNGIADSLSHELKTPVASINGFAKLLLEENLPQEKQKKYLEIIVKESDRLAALAKNNLLLSKIDAQEIVTDKEPYNLSRQIQDIAISMETEWSGKNINVSADLPDAIYDGNANLMESLWQNLLSNAIKFTPKNGDISITLSEAEDGISVSVADTGKGMSEEIREHIFERYYQSDASRASEGHGLGLSIVDRIVRLCGGKIIVDSKEGEGSIFSIILMFAMITVTGVIVIEATGLDFEIGAFLILNLGITCLHLAISGIAYLASCIFNSSSRSMQFGAGLPVFFFVCNMLAIFSNYAEIMEYFKYFTIFSFYNYSNIMAYSQNMIWQFPVLFGIAAVCYIFRYLQ